MVTEITPPALLKTDRLDALSAAAEGSSALSVASNQSTGAGPTTSTKFILPTKFPRKQNVGNTVDLFNSPRKKSPPWKGTDPESKKAEEALATTSLVWFIDKYPDSPLASSIIKTTRIVETSLRLRFPKCLPIAFQLLEFLAHTRSHLPIAPAIHKESLLVNDYATSMPLIWFSGIIYSQTLVMTVATRLFAYPKTPPDRQRTIHPTLWGSSLPTVVHQNKDNSYQFWVVHLKGCNGKVYRDSLDGNQKPVYNTFKKTLVAFFELQFDSMRKDEKQNIRDGLTQNCETIYIASFNSAKDHAPTIVAATQYCSSEEGAFINWIAVASDIPDDTKLAGVLPVRKFRRLGLGMFLQTLIQFQQVSRGRSSRLLLQCIVDGDACQYYLNRGYIKSRRNQFEVIDNHLDHPFVSHHLHFITDKAQEEDKVDPLLKLHLYQRDGFVITTYLDDKHNFFFLEGANINCYPKGETEVLFRFPYNTSGSVLETFLDVNSLILFKFPNFRQKVDYVLPENVPSKGMFKGLVRPINQFEGHFDSADVDRAEYLLMKENPQEYIKEQTLFLWSRWTLRNPDSDYEKDVAVIPPFISGLVVDIVKSLAAPSCCNTSQNSALVSQLDLVDKYLYGHPQLLSKRLIFLWSTKTKTIGLDSVLLILGFLS